MLSTVDLFVAGATNEESIDLVIDDQVVHSWQNIGGDAERGEFVRLSYQTAQLIQPEQVRIQFTNDRYDPSQGIDRNVRLDAIEIDGKRYEAEAPNVFSTGTWIPGVGVEPGFQRSETLHTNGSFQFGTSETWIDFVVGGTTGEEEFVVQIDGEERALWHAATELQTFTLYIDRDVRPDEVRVVFLNDAYNPSTGFDRNLRVDRIVLNGVTIETESEQVLSTGTWKSHDGVTTGFRRSETLHANGYFQFGTPSTEAVLSEIKAREQFGVANDIAELQDPARATPLVRVTEPSYPGDGSGIQWKAPEPSENPQSPPNSPNNTGTAVQPLKITETIYAPGSDENRPNSAGLNEFSQFFAQFVTHDMVHSVRAGGPPIFLDGQFIPVARTPAVTIDGVLQQVSSDTPTLDLGLVYGKDELASEVLREVADENGHPIAGARLISGGSGDVLPSFAEVAAHRGLTVEEAQQILGTTFLNLPPSARANQAATGDERANQTTSLTVHHTIWHRNHNWHVDQLRGQNPDWSEEQLYQAARAMNEAEYQRIVYEEYLPKLLGEEALSEYGGYNQYVHPSIINEWTTVAFRFGHDQASAGQTLLTEDGQISFVPLEFSSLLSNNGQNIKSDEELGDWTRGQLWQSSQEIDGRIVPSLRNALFGVPASADDPTGADDEFLQLNLPLLDIHRGRDHGVSDYNQLRAGLGLATYSSLEEFAEENGLGEARLQQLKSVYDDISELDSIVGGLLEAKSPGSQLGETFTVLNVMQFEATRAGDEYFYLNRFSDSPELLDKISDTSMASILQRVGAVDHIGDDAFQAWDPVGTIINVDARGDTGDEVLVLEVNGERVARWEVDTTFQTFTYRSSKPIAATDVRIVFDNDAFDSVTGVDRNLQVDKMQIDQWTIEMESDYVYSTGTWVPDEGIAPGYRHSEFLNAMGYFQFGFGLDQG